MKSIWLCTYGTIARIRLADTSAEAALLAVPDFDGFPPDAVYDVTAELVTLASNLIQLARSRVGDGAESRFRYRVDTVVGIWRGEPPPDDMAEAYAKEWQARKQLEDQLIQRDQELAALRAELDASRQVVAG